MSSWGAIQQQLAQQGLKKDYVQIASTILKENPTGQDPELRSWAVQMLSDNSPVPFSNKAKQNLQQGNTLVVTTIWPPLIPPPSLCMKSPPVRTVGAAWIKLTKKTKDDDINAFAKDMTDFGNFVIKQEADAEYTRINLICLQKWAAVIVNSDDEWRKMRDMPSSAQDIARIRAADVASAARAASAASTASH